ncbi:hypothetical protein HanRHA438_Chr07g0292981 [Helianthus annuus]|nr:hypothetical protein HanIR_Chr07g0304341 [Helianthus annuus]KAJ0906938.1 hypothetical protein HanRHA438_Chr07g0292981 [Helianthus annuus]
MGLGDKAFVTDPSGPYFLGLPLFFFSVTGVAPAGGDAAGYGGDKVANWLVMD